VNPEDGLIHVLPAESQDSQRRVAHEVTDRWLAAYAVAVGDLRSPYVDLERPDGIMAHPMFPSCLEWPLVEFGAPGILLSEATLRRGLHVQADVEYQGQIRSGHQLTTTAELYIAEQRSTATHIAIEFQTVDEGGARLATGRTHMLYPGVKLDGHKSPTAKKIQAHAPSSEELLQPIADFAVDETNAVIYSECARIWNPIHTDIRVAKAAGLQSTVLHGTETLARAVSLITSALPGSPTSLDTLTCRFTGIVTPGEKLTVRASALRDRRLDFDVISEGGSVPISNGRLTLAEQDGSRRRNSS